MIAEGGFGLTPHEIRRTAWEWAHLNGIPLPPSETRDEEGMMSYHWYARFMERHGGNIKVLKPQEMSIYRATAATQEGVDGFFNQLEFLANKYKITSDQIWNIDETGMMDQPKAQKVIVPMHHPGLQIVPGERGQLTTVLCFASASGMVAHPTVIMKGKNVLQRWREFKPPSWNLYSSKNGWINKKIFLSTGRKFLKFLEQQGLYGKPHIVLLDGHSSHSFNFPFSVLMAAHNVFVVTFPAHCTHFLQPFDACILAKLKAVWQNNLRIWNRMHAGARLSKAQFFIVFRRAWREALTETIIQASFRKTGIWPLDQAKVNRCWFNAREALGEMAYGGEITVFGFV